MYLPESEIISTLIPLPKKGVFLQKVSSVNLKN